MRPLDPVRVALALAVEHGVDDAIAHAALEVGRGADDPNRPGRGLWRAVLALLDEMQRTRPRGSERVH